MATQVEELTRGDPGAVVVENARRKARAGLEMAGGDGPALGVDTEVVLDGRLLGKAGTEEEARQHLAALSGRTHEVLSGVVLIEVPHSLRQQFVRGERTNDSFDPGRRASVPDPRPEERAGVERSRVTFRELTPALIDAYLASGEWRDRAGAYAVQGLGSMLVAEVAGDLSNVIGLPVNLLLELVPDLLDAAGDSQLQSGF